VAGKKERQRRLARERHARQMARRAQRTHKVRIRAIVTGGVCALAAVGVGAYFLAGTGGGKSAAASASASASPTPSASASPTAAAVAEPAHHCTYISNGTASGTAARKVSVAPSSPNYTAKYQATIVTNRGSIVINLLNSKATCTVNSFVHLAEQKYFSSTKCHRLTTTGIFVLQCGDPTGTGTGGPGYAFASENLTGATYPAGTVAMANTGQPNSNGSQFFLVYKSSPLPPSYTPFGTITQGLPILDAIAKAGSDNANAAGDGHPKENVVIDNVTIKQT
jgi:peptidyl-prolyl cis-trans isomerase B (cyclophilin B)